jgi:hypothetical protein
MFSFTEGTTEEAIEAIREGLMGLPAVIPQIRSYRVGRDAGVNPGNFDFVVVGDFDDAEGYLTYRDHPAHQQLIQDLIAPVASKRAAIQHEWHPALPDDLPG